MQLCRWWDGYPINQADRQTGRQADSANVATSRSSSAFAPKNVSLDRSMLAQYPADTTLRYFQLATHTINTMPTTRGA